MEFEGLKIKEDSAQTKAALSQTVNLQVSPVAQAVVETVDSGVAKNAGAAKKESDSGMAEATEYSGTFSVGIGNSKEVLENMKKEGLSDRKEVVYGIYSNEQSGVFTKINDYFIDHSKITLKDKSYLFHMLAVMVDAGIPVIKALKSLAQRTTNLRLSRILYTISYDIEHGANLADSMRRFEDVFEASDIGIVKTGEASGRLNIMLFKLSAQLDKRYELNGKVIGAMFYPIVVVVLLLAVSAGMLLWVLPSIMGLFGDFIAGGGKMPLSTRVLLAAQGVLAYYWWAILLGILVVYGVFTAYKNTNYGAFKIDYFLLRFPVLGELIRKVNVLRFVDMLGILIDAGLPVLKALEITAGSFKNKVYRLSIGEIYDRVKVGEKISAVLADYEFLYPAEVVQIINIGESTASLVKVTEKISEQYNREIDNALKRLMAVFEPLMILFVGVFVALLALAILQPIFNLSGILGG